MGLGKVLISRNGAYGDMIHMSHLPRLLKDQGWDFVGVSTGYKGKQILAQNPFVDRLHYFEAGTKIKMSLSYYNGRVRAISQNYDKVINLLHSLEMNCLFLEQQNEYYQHISMRRKMGQENYYDIATDWAGYPELKGKYRGEVFFENKDINIVEHDLLRPGRFKDKFKVMLNLSGSNPHKIFLHAKDISKWILDTYDDAVIFTTGDSSIEYLDVRGLGERVRSLVGKKGFRQVLLMAKYMDCVIGCESGIMCGASMWDVPTIQLMTCADINNHCKYTTKDYSLQSPARCSPCYKGPYEYYGCPKRNDLPLCVYFDINKIKHQIERIYAEHYKMRKSS